MPCSLHALPVGVAQAIEDVLIKFGNPSPLPFAAAILFSWAGFAYCAPTHCIGERPDQGKAKQCG